MIVNNLSEYMDEEKKTVFNKKLKEYNESQIHPIIHINTTFETLANAISDELESHIARI
jgi:hypothetical protein